MKYDYLIIGSGLFGAVFAHEATKKGKKCLVVEKRNHIGGNVYTENIEGINIHKYGAHIFHTDYKDVWEYVNNLVEFNRYTNCPIAVYKDEVYNLPFNMNTFNKLWGVVTPEEAKLKIEEEKKEFSEAEPKNLEEQAISLVGKTIYEKLIKGYTEKQWGMDCKELPSFIIKRLPVRLVYDNNYFNDRYQGIPMGGYTALIEKLLAGSDIKLNYDYFDHKAELNGMFDKMVYTGMIDRFYNYKFGHLEYRSLRFETDILDIDNYQGNAVVNYTSRDVDYTRIIEHKHFESTISDKTIITKEYPDVYTDGKEAYYTINNDKNNNLYLKYKKLADLEDKIIFGGRLAEYKYYDMDDVIKEALKVASKELGD